MELIIRIEVLWDEYFMIFKYRSSNRNYIDFLRNSFCLQWLLTVFAINQASLTSNLFNISLYMDPCKLRVNLNSLKLKRLKVIMLNEKLIIKQKLTFAISI
jgi:hypothetical protein